MEKKTYIHIKNFLEKNSKSKLITTEKEYDDINNNKCKLKLQCSCGDFFLKSWNDIYSKKKYYCRKCGINQRALKQTLSSEIFKEKVLKKHGEKYIVIGDYINSKTKVSVKHIDCGTIWDVVPNNFLKGTRCPTCYGSNKYSLLDFQKLVAELEGDKYIVLGEIKTYKKSMFLIKHTMCGHTYKIRAIKFKMGNRCVKCSGLMVKNNDIFSKELYDLYKDEYKRLSNYKSSESKIKIKHSVCGHIWWVRPTNILRGSGCPRCKSSRGEKKCIDFFVDNNIHFIHQKKFNDLRHPETNRLLRFDFYIPQKNLVIEYDGIQHFEPTSFGSNKTEKYKNNNFIENMILDEYKNNYCAEKNIKICRISYFNLDNIGEILKGELL